METACGKGPETGEMPSDTPARPSMPVVLLIIAFSAWTSMVLYLTAPIPPGQRVFVAGSLLAVGALICGMGYLSTLRRGALRKRQETLDKLLEMRRRERTR